MQRHRFTIANLLLTVAVVAILLAVFRAGSFMGLLALVPFGITLRTAQSGAPALARRHALWAGAAGTLLLPFLVAVWLNHGLWGYYISRPDVDRRIVEARKIETMTRVVTGSDAGGGLTFSGTRSWRWTGSFRCIHWNTTTPFWTGVCSALEGAASSAV